MTGTCNTPRAWSELVDYWAGDLDVHLLEALEDHLIGCGECSALSARVAALSEAFRNTIRPVITRATLNALERKGMRIEEHTMTPGERKDVTFRRDVDLLIHRLGQLNLDNATRVSFTMRVDASDQVLAHVESVPFDAREGAVLVACQRHFAHMPPDLVADVTVFDASGGTSTTSYTILHHYEAR